MRSLRALTGAVLGLLCLGALAQSPPVVPSQPQPQSGPPPGRNPFDSGPQRPDAPQPSSDPHDLRGYYFMPLGGVLLRGLNRNDMPLNAQGLAIFNRRIADREAGRIPDDPMIQCRPMNAVRVFASGFPQIQILQTRDEVLLFLMEDHIVRHIYLNARHPAGLKPTSLGHSIGHWDGDTLVVDTTGFQDNGWLDETGTPSDHNEHLVERIRKLDGGQTVEDLATLEDPSLFTRPVSFRVTLLWRPSESWDEIICEEGNRDGLALPGSDASQATP